MIDHTLYEEFNEYCLDVARNPTGADALLWGRICEYEADGLFDDMTFSPNSIVSKFVKYEYQNEGGKWISSWDDMKMALDDEGNWFRYYVRELEPGVGGQANSKERTIVIDPKYAEDKTVILHELIHAHEYIVNERYMFYHDILTLCLYNDLKNKISDLDDRILDHTHIIHGTQISHQGGSHDILFFLKSLDLDLRLGCKLGTVCGYRRDRYANSPDT